jgi:hypothetical protein
MARAVCLRPLIVEARVLARVNSCGVSGRQSGAGTDFSPVLRFNTLKLIPLWISILIYHLER